WLANAPVSVLVSRRLIDAVPMVVVTSGLCIGAFVLLEKQKKVALAMFAAAHALTVVSMPIPQGVVPFERRPADATKRYA
ncbi:hypothetical protein ABTM78_21310, partial [Acinetobacter baumannii]